MIMCVLDICCSVSPAGQENHQKLVNSVKLYNFELHSDEYISSIGENVRNLGQDPMHERSSRELYLDSMKI